MMDSQWFNLSLNIYPPLDGAKIFSINASSNIWGFGSLSHTSISWSVLREYDLGIYPKTGWFLGRINPAFTGFPQIVPEAPSAAAHCVDIPSKGYGCTATPGRFIDSHCHSMIIIINISISLMMTCNSFSVSPSFSLLLWLSFIHWVIKPTQKMWAELRARHPKTWTFAMFDGIQISILWS